MSEWDVPSMPRLQGGEPEPARAVDEALDVLDLAVKGIDTHWVGFPEIASSLATVRAEIERLREERDVAIHQRGVGTEWAAELAGKLASARDERDDWEAKALDRLLRAEAAEARVRRLKEALRLMLAPGNSVHAAATKIARALLAEEPSGTAWT